MANIPKEFGGKFEFGHGMGPKLDKETRRALVWLSESSTGLPAGPIKWIANKEGERTAVAVGRINGKQRHESFATLSP